MREDGGTARSDLGRGAGPDRRGVWARSGAMQAAPNAVGGVASARVSNEAAYLFQKFFRALVGTNNVDFPMARLCGHMPPACPAITDIAKSDLIVLVGFDPSEAAPVLDLHIKRAVRRGVKAKLLIIHPRRIELAKYPGAYLPVLPGNEAALLNELAAAIQARKASESASRQTSEQEWRDQAGGRTQNASTQYAIRPRRRSPVRRQIAALHLRPGLRRGRARAAGRDGAEQSGDPAGLRR